LGSIAEFEHALMSERTLDGLAAARARGRNGGQKPKLGPRQVKLARQMYDETGRDGKRKYTVAQIAAELDVSRPTIYRHLAQTAHRNETRLTRPARCAGVHSRLAALFVPLFPHGPAPAAGMPPSPPRSSNESQAVRL
jgi:DNA invertase Pin-like site-specific DNA recombinase